MLSSFVLIVSVKVSNDSTEASQLTSSVEVPFNFSQSFLFGFFCFESEPLSLCLLFLRSWATLGCLCILLWRLCFGRWSCLLLWVTGSTGVCASLLLSGKSISKLFISCNHSWRWACIYDSFWLIHI